MLLLTGCISNWHAPDDFIYIPIQTDAFEIATWQKILMPGAPTHIYIEGDGHAFDGRGAPTRNPTPRGTFLRDLATADDAPNVVYMARPCQYIKSPTCDQADWTHGRFSSRVIDSMATAIEKIVGAGPVVLIGYSGGALVSGLIIQNHPEINAEKWVTIAGVLNHYDWTQYFGDSPLKTSMNLNELPNIPQTHYVAENDKIVPLSLSKQWTDGENLVIIPNATHDDFGHWIPEFD